MPSLRLARATIVAITLATLAVTPGRAEPVDDTRLFSADSSEADWLLPGRDYSNRRFSPLDQVNITTIKRLVPKWIYQTGTAATLQTTPLVADGVMYVSAPFSHVMALDARSGREIWRYEHKATTKKLCCGPANRGVGLGYGKVFVATVDARLVALDQTSGQVVWDIPLAGPVEAASPSEDRAALSGDDPALKGVNRHPIGARDRHPKRTHLLIGVITTDAESDAAKPAG